MSIERSRNWNPGGGNWLEVLPCLAAEAVAGSAGSYQPRANESWSRIYCTQETLTFSQKQSQTDNGLVYATSIRGFSPADDTTRAAEFLALTSRGRVLVRFRDNARLTRLVGTPTEGLEFTCELTTDDTVGGSRGYTVNLTGTFSTSCRYE